MKEKFFAVLLKLGLIQDDKKDAVLKALNSVEPDPEPEPQPSQTPEMIALRKDLIANRQQLKDLEGLMNQEITRRENAERLMAERMKKDQEKEIADAVKLAFDNKKLTEDKRQWATDYATSNLASFKEWEKNAGVVAALDDKTEKSSEKKEGGGKDKGIITGVDYAAKRGDLIQEAIQELKDSRSN